MADQLERVTRLMKASAEFAEAAERFGQVARRECDRQNLRRAVSRVTSAPGNILRAIFSGGWD